MFNNIGGKVKVVAIVYFVLVLLSTISGAIVCWALDAVGQGFGILFGGIIGALFSAWVIYCIGDTNSKVEELQEQVSALRTERQNRPANAPSARPAPQAPAQQPAEPAAARPFVPTQPKDGYGFAIPAGADREQCSVCGTVQNAGRNVCWNCGIRFQRDEQIWECPSCGRKNKGSDVCWNCGTKFRRDR